MCVLCVVCNIKRIAVLAAHSKVELLRCSVACRDCHFPGTFSTDVRFCSQRLSILFAVESSNLTCCSLCNLFSSGNLNYSIAFSARGSGIDEIDSSSEEEEDK